MVGNRGGKPIDFFISAALTRRATGADYPDLTGLGWGVHLNGLTAPSQLVSWLLRVMTGSY